MQTLEKKPSNWNQINWKEQHCYSHKTKDQPFKKVDKKSLEILFPKEKQTWYAVPGGAYRTTSNYYTTDKHKHISGFSFKGQVAKSENFKTNGQQTNELAIFFHKVKDFGGGPEFGWVFRENSSAGLFYILSDANKSNQQWRQWPDNLKTIKITENFSKALKEISKERYWNIKVLKNGDFKLSIINPKNWHKESCVVKKPAWFENLYQQSGYITVTAQKLKDSDLHKHELSLKEIKLWQ